MTQAPATGLWGPGDFPADFVTIEGLEDEMYALPDSGDQADDDFAELNAQIMQRKAVRDFALDLAHDLDARGLVTVEEAADHGDVKAFYAGFRAAVGELTNGLREFSTMPAAGRAAKTFREFADGLEKLPVDNIVNKWLARQQADDPLPPDPNTGS